MGLPRVKPLGVRQIKFYGPFDLHVLLKGIKRFLDDRGYEFQETVKMKKGSDGWKFETNWYARIKATEFVRKHIEIYFLIMEIRDVEVVIDGKKVKMQHGRGIIEVRGSVEFAHEDVLSNFTWNEKLLDFFLNYVYKEQYLGKWVDNHWYELQALAAHIRGLLNFEVK